MNWGWAACGMRLRICCFPARARSRPLPSISSSCRGFISGWNRSGRPLRSWPFEIGKLEIELARELEDSGETEGVIGRIAKEKLQRLPSSIYWQGLHVWGIRVFSGSQDEYHRSLDLFYQRQRSGTLRDMSMTVNPQTNRTYTIGTSDCHSRMTTFRPVRHSR